jgi:hypothetical protein
LKKKKKEKRKKKKRKSSPRISIHRIQKFADEDG